MKHLITGILIIILNLSAFSQSTRDITHSIPSKVFDTTRTVQVHLPPKFEPEEQLPVVYVFDAQWAPYFQLVTATTNYLTAITALPRCIVVGIHNEKRQYELTPAPVNDNWKIPSLGGAKLLENHLIKEVQPFIKAQYHSNDYSIGIGHSLGGTFVLNSLVDQPDLFDAYLAISPNLEIDDEAIVLKLQGALAAIEAQQAFIYASMGTDGTTDQQFMPAIKKLNRIMTSTALSQTQWIFKIHEKYHHGNTPLMGIQEGLISLAEQLATKTK